MYTDLQYNKDRKTLADLTNTDINYWVLIRENYYWGISPTFKNIKTNQIYFCIDGKPIPEIEYLKEILNTWKPNIYIETQFYLEIEKIVNNKDSLNSF